MKHKKILCALCGICLITSMAGCGVSKNKEPIQLTLWHVYGEQVASPINELIDEFNSTVGQKEGIQITVTSVSNSNKIHEGVLAAVNHEPGAPELPDIFNCYPKTVSAMQDSDMLVDYRDYFSDADLEGYIKEFLDEGTFDKRLLIFPVAKSTELLFINKTLFDRFAKETGAKLDDLATWEGLYKAASLYAEWSGGKAFLANDYPFHYFQVGVQALGEDFFRDEQFSFCQSYQTAWDVLAPAAIKGGVWLGEGYATEALRTGDAIATLASSASVLYYENIVTYEDNTSEEIEIISLPYPNFENGKKMVMQRGSGFCTVKSTPEREKAACTFIKWLTAPEQNTKFVTSLGYVPVCYEAYDKYLIKETEQLTDPKYKDLYKTIQDINPDYEFVYPPRFDSYLDSETAFTVTVRRLLSDARQEYIDIVDAGGNPDSAVYDISGKYFERLQSELQ
ncbi:MAG: extracellular solute-binding protein [Clostridia bacterium]|nr:extracellular solute-binding protein [Clostridia bacterium]